MPSLKQSDLARVTSALPHPVRDLLQEQRVYLAGGFIRHVVARESGKTDIDLFGLGFDAANEAAVNMTVTYTNDHGIGMDVYDTPNAISLIPSENADEYPMQFIYRWPLDCAEKIIEHFDFTVCAAVVWWDSLNQIWKSQIHPHFYADLDEQKLVYTGSDEPAASLLRALKYSRRGYHIYAYDTAQILEDIAAKKREAENLSDAPVPFLDLLLAEAYSQYPMPTTESRTEKVLSLLDEDTIPF
jgi:hypothetical protein